MYSHLLPEYEMGIIHHDCEESTGSGLSSIAFSVMSSLGSSFSFSFEASGSGIVVDNISLTDLSYSTDVHSYDRTPSVER